ncbi:hypothetical protein Slala03_77050 [Streptomyces lavendulae subsp. lavendulae]|nr:hypothetical protein Slala03_77050 [Streptomyces lavendulae subsp. lavendulae]
MFDLTRPPVPFAPVVPAAAPVVPAAAPVGWAGAPAAPPRGETARMETTLTHGQTTGQGEAVAPAAPATAGAAPGPRPGAPARPESTPAAPRPGGQGWPGVAGQGVSTAGATGNVDPAAVATPTAGVRVSPRVLKALGWAAVVAMVPVVVIGFMASYTTLAALAVFCGFAVWLAPWIPVAVDGAILGFLSLDLYLTGRRISWPLLRVAAHAMTAATVVINAVAGAVATVDGGAGPAVEVPGALKAFWHGLMPLLFVFGVEGVRRLIVHATQLEDGTAIDRIPLHRWALSPWRTPKLYREMRLANVRSYPEMVERKRALEGYKVWLKQELGGDLSEATDEQLLPMTMASQGFSVEEALALPAKWRAEAEERERAEAERQRAEAERVRLQKKADALAVLEDDSDIVVAKHEQAARTGTAAAKAEAARAAAESEAAAAKAAAEHRRTAAERQSLAEAEALESRDAAAARRKAAEDTAEAERAEAEAERQRAEKEKVAAEAARQRAAAARHAEAEERAKADKLGAEKAAAEAARALADTRYQTALIEARAQQAEDYARLLPRERSERLVARMLLAAGSVPEQADEPPQLAKVPLSEIMDKLAIGQTAAGDIRKAAAARILAGYRATEFELMMDGATQQS